MARKGSRTRSVPIFVDHWPLPSGRTASARAEPIRKVIPGRIQCAGCGQTILPSLLIGDVCPACLVRQTVARESRGG